MLSTFKNFMRIFTWPVLLGSVQKTSKFIVANTQKNVWLINKILVVSTIEYAYYTGNQIFGGRTNFFLVILEFGWLY